MTDSDIYIGNSFSITRIGGDWAIWRFSGGDGDREQIILTDEAMNELADYFADCFAEDSGRVAP